MRRWKVESAGGVAAVVAALALQTMPPASAQQAFNQAIIFGDSSVDSGFFKALPNPGGGALYNSLWAQAVAAGAGAPTTNPGLMNSQILASYFGLTANPANQPGGTNFATSGAKSADLNFGPNDGFLAAVPVVSQIQNYLDANNGHANSNGLYLISAGANDVSATFGPGTVQQFRIQFVQGQADNLATSVAELRNAGARTILVPDLAFSFPQGNADEQQVRLAYSQELWSKLQSFGVAFIPADFNAVRVAIAANPLAFGFTNGVSNAAGSTACTAPAGITSAWALLCSSNPAAPSHFQSANADQTYLFADDQHFTTAGQKIEADYFYSLLVGPSEASLLTLSTVQARTATVVGIQDQIDIARRRPGTGFNIWVTGDVASQQTNPATLGIPGDTGVPFAGTAGLDYRAQNVLFGAAFTTGQQTSRFDLGGSFRQDEIAGSIYGEYFNGPGWLNVIGSYGTQNYNVNRVVPIGITLQNNTGSTKGTDESLAVQGGYEFVLGNLTHGPVAGLTWQRARAGAFTETGSFTSLSFADQSRVSAISSLGYKVSLDYGRFRPFAQLAWDHELGPLGSVTASLTTIAAPSYTMDAALPGRDWATATIGSTMTLDGGLTGLAAFTAQEAQNGVKSYGGRVGLNYAIGAPDLARTQAHAQLDPSAQPVASTPSWAPWTVTSSSEVRVYSWRDTLTAPGAPAGSGSKGSEVYVPYALQLDGKVIDKFDVEIVVRGGWVNANNRTPGMAGEVGTPTDTTMSGTVTYTGAEGVQPFVALQTNLPTGTSRLLGASTNALMDPDLVEIATFGEGLNVGGTLGVNVLPSSEWILTTSIGYTSRGAFDREVALPLTFDSTAPFSPLTTLLKPGDNFTLVQAIAYTKGDFSTRLTGTLSLESTTFQGGLETLRPGNRYVLASDTAYTWTPEIGTTTLSASVSHSNRNDVFDVPLNALTKELTDTNSDVYRVSLQHLFPVGAFAVGPLASFLYRDHNGYDSETLQFVPAKQRYSAGVQAKYNPIPDLTFNARAEAIWTHEGANPAVNDLKLSEFAGGLVPAVSLPIVSGTAWQTSIGFNYKL